MSEVWIFVERKVEMKLVLGGGRSRCPLTIIDLDVNPIGTITTRGIANACRTYYYIENDMTKPARTAFPNKPRYRIPLMKEVAQTPWNGLSLVSTFSGCGGSCLGFRMAGYRTLWASEFIEAARDTYTANHPGVPIDGRDIRSVTAEDILRITGLKKGELDVLEGSPPCASFSTAGTRQEGWGKVKTYSNTKQRTDDLFFEYIRLIDGLQPKMFVAENVSGLVKGSAKGYFKEILAAMKAVGYHVETRVLDATWLGVPQTRQRLIFIGLRNDLSAPLRWPSPLPYFYSVRDALHELDETPAGIVGGSDTDTGVGEVRQTKRFIAGNDLGDSAIGKEWDKLKPGEASNKYFSLVRPHLDQPCPTVTQTGGKSHGVACVTHPVERRKFTIAELRRICGFPDDFALTGSYSQQWERLGRAVPPPMMAAVAAEVREVLHGLGVGSARAIPGGASRPPKEKRNGNASRK